MVTITFDRSDCNTGAALRGGWQRTEEGFVRAEKVLQALPQRRSWIYASRQTKEYQGVCDKRGWIPVHTLPPSYESLSCHFLELLLHLEDRKVPRYLGHA